MPLPLPADIARHPDKQGTSEIPKLLVAYSADEINEQFGEGSNAYFRIFSEGFWKQGIKFLSQASKVGLFGVAMDEREALAVDSSSDAELVNVSSRRRRTITVTLVGGVALLVNIVALSRSSYALSSQHMEDATEEFAQADVDEDQPNWQMVQQERDLCSKPKEDCLKTQCCKTSGYKCYKQPAGNVGKCMRYCKKKGCMLVDKMVHLQVEAPNGILAPAETMFCFSVYTQNTGSTKKSTEKELLTEQHKRQVSIFACNAFAVYSDVAADLGGGTSTIKVSGIGWTSLDELRQRQHVCQLIERKACGQDEVQILCW